MTAARKGNWGIVGDALWVALGEKVVMPPADLDTDLTVVTVQVELGWRVIDTDYQQGEGEVRFAWDMRLQGDRFRVSM